MRSRACTAVVGSLIAGESSADGDVDEHAQRKGGVLVDRALAGEHEDASRERQVRVRPPARDPQHQPPRHEILADRGHNAHEATRLVREAQQCGAVDGRDDGGRPRVRDLGRVDVLERRRGGIDVRGVARVDVVDHRVAAPHQRAQDAPICVLSNARCTSATNAPSVINASSSPHSTVTVGRKSRPDSLVWRPIAASANSE